MRGALPSRRELFKATAALVGAGLIGDGVDVLTGSAGRCNIGACDWSIGMRGETGAMALARQLGIDGAQVSMGNVESGLQLRRPEVQRAYRDAAEANGV